MKAKRGVPIATAMRHLLVLPDVVQAVGAGRQGGEGGGTKAGHAKQQVAVVEGDIGHSCDPPVVLGKAARVRCPGIPAILVSGG
jgi:hypothetical protein